MSATDALLCLAASVGADASLACTCDDADIVAMTRLLLGTGLGDDPFCPFPSNLDLFVALTEGGTGQLGTVATEEISSASLTRIAWSPDADGVRIHAGRLEMDRYSELRWEEIRLALDEPSVAGAPHATGRGFLEGGYLGELWGDILCEAPFSAAVVAVPDFDRPLLELGRSLELAGDGVFVGSTLYVSSSEPVLASELVTRVRLHVNQHYISGEATLVDPVGRFATLLAFKPDDYLPFSSRVYLDALELRDPAGFRATYPLRTLETMADAGPALTNPDFEAPASDGTPGWSGARVAARPVLVDGRLEYDHQAYLYTGDYDQLLGYFDLPPDAAELAFSARVEGECFYPGCTRGVEVALLTPGEHRPVFIPTFELDPDHASWDCESGVRFLPATRVHADVADLAGSRVFVYAKAYWEILCPDYSLFLDDFAVVVASTPLRALGSAGDDAMRRTP